MQKKSFSLESSLYQQEYLLQAIENFGQEFSMTYEDGMLIIAGENSDDIQQIFDEFMNHVLALSNE